MLVEPSQQAVTITQVLGWARDLGFLGALIIIAWNARGKWDGAKSFIAETRAFMKTMTNHADTLVTNHLEHLQKSGERIEKALAQQSALLQEISDSTRKTKRK